MCEEFHRLVDSRSIEEFHGFDPPIQTSRMPRQAPNMRDGELAERVHCGPLVGRFSDLQNSNWPDGPRLSAFCPAPPSWRATLCTSLVNTTKVTSLSMRQRG